jgi:hypothetical protein
MTFTHLNPEALLKSHRSGPLPDAFAPDQNGQRFCGDLDFQQMPVMIDWLRNESPIHFGWDDEPPTIST